MEEEEEWLYYTIIIPVEGVKMIKCGAWIRLEAKNILFLHPFPLLLSASSLLPRFGNQQMDLLLTTNNPLSPAHGKTVQLI